MGEESTIYSGVEKALRLYGGLRVLDEHQDGFQFPTIAPDRPAAIFVAMVQYHLSQAGMDALAHGFLAIGTFDRGKSVAGF